MSRPPGRKTVYILDAPQVDDGHGNESRDWTGQDVSRRPVRGCDVQPGSSMEFLLGRDAVLVAYTVFAPAGTIVNAYQHVEWMGVQYTIYGDPERWATGQPSDYVGILLQKWNG